MGTPHKHRDIIIAWANGEEIEFRNMDCGSWFPMLAEDPIWYEYVEYRIKPKIVKKEGWVNIHIASIGPLILSGIFSTEEDAKKYAGLTTVNKIITVRIEWEEEE